MNQTTMKMKCILFLILGSLAWGVSGQTTFEYPEIADYGGAVGFEKSIAPVNGGKILVDLTTGDTDKQGINKGLDKVARLINLYALADVAPESLDIAVIIHGPATKVVLSNMAYQEKFQSTNPDRELIGLLRTKGVKVMVCGQALVRRGFGTEGLSTDVDLALSAMTTLVEYQQKGYAVLYF